MYCLDDYKKSLRFVVSNNNLSIYEFIPSMTNLLAVWMEPKRLVRTIRLLLEFLRGGYMVYYLVKDKDIIGYCIVTPGGRRLKCSSKRDAVIGPYFISLQYRGLGFSKRLINMVSEICKRKYESIYAWVDKKNIPSCRCMEACGFEHIGNLDVVGLMRRLVSNPQGDDFIYKKNLIAMTD